MKNKFEKFIIILGLNLILLISLTQIVSLTRQTLTALIFIVILISIVEAWLSQLWEMSDATELAVMKKRMQDTLDGETPRGVLVSPESPYYDLLQSFNALQTYVRHSQYDNKRDVGNYQTLLTSLPVGVINVDRHHTIDVFNQKAADLLGVSLPKLPISENLIIRQFTLSELISQTFNTQSKQQSILNLTINGETRQYDASTLYHQSGAEGEVMIMLYDLTSVLQIERMQADFLANASHEFKTPLTAITGFVETLQGPAGDDPKTRAQFLTIVANESQRLSDLVNDILSLSRLKHKADGEVSMIKVSEIVNQQIQKINSQRVKIHNAVAEKFEVLGVSEDATTIIQNLLTNAVKYNVENGEVWVTAKKDKSQWTLSVRDSGIGIPLSQQSRIFERFYRGDESRQRKIASGTGLGLAIVNEIVTKHNGQLQVKSQVGVGTTITLTLPL
ncbi:MAG: ATP-binding protein [Leuconostoc pseudomesenteroides]|jgi:two-component system phosphate regulon sensor histidine kinase PhoR|uniref:sensor histidine kinase n=1 Tax=Leuconostoc pseudomesenteroides TaxID=33968 RepID=UPI0011223F55|nr:ATP-binding protein [Leuconostoc pseudomesenteroides]TOZ08039.1 histidine kinase [Leuconostoc pseudomesenteroides]